MRCKSSCAVGTRTLVHQELRRASRSRNSHTHPAREAAHFRRILAAHQNLSAAERALRDAVLAAREAGDSWTIIGAALDTSRQAAQQRFGH